MVATSGSFRWSLRPVGLRPELAGAVDALALPWYTSGLRLWTNTVLNPHDGSDCATVGEVAHTQQSTLCTVVTGPGTVTFWWRVSSEQDYDFLTFAVDGLDQGRISGASGGSNGVLPCRKEPISCSGATPKTKTWRTGRTAPGSTR